MEQLRVRCWFEIQAAGIEPEQITNVLGIEPAAFWRVGEPKPGGGPIQPLAGWRLNTPLPGSIDFDEMAAALLALLPRERPSEARAQEWLMQLTYVVELSHATPAMYLEPETLERLSKLRAALDIDMYVFTPTPEGMDELL
jgi:hypothetical protein